MRRRNEGPGASQPESQDMERSSSATGSGTYTTSSSGATGSSMQEQGGTNQQGTSQQGGVYQQGGPRTGSTTSYGQSAAPAPQGSYGTSGSGGHGFTSRQGAGLALLAGSLAFLQGLAFVIRSAFYHFSVAGYAYRWNLHGWGWTLLILGALLFAGGVSVLLGLKGARQVAGVIAIITAAIAFITIFYSVIWGIVVLAASGFAARELMHHQRSASEFGVGDGYGAGGQNYQQQGYQQQGYQQQGYPQQGYQDDTMAGQGQGSRRRF
jgi:hypothetical protein